MVNEPSISVDCFNDYIDHNPIFARKKAMYLIFSHVVKRYESRFPLHSSGFLNSIMCNKDNSLYNCFIPFDDADFFYM